MYAQSLHRNEQTGKTNNNLSQKKSFIPKRSATSNTNVNKFIQPKLSIGQPNDTYEQEADSIATKVVTMSKPAENSQGTSSSISTIASPKTQRKSLASTVSPIVQRASTNTSKKTSTSNDISQKLSSRNGKGDRMDADTSDYMESRFGSNFSNVRIHKDENAVQMSQDIGARAFTNGNNIYFNKGQYSPNSSNGKHLLAHELTHTIQQKGANAVQRAIIQKQAAPGSELARLREILDKFNVPESEVIAIFGSLNATDSNTALNDSTLKEQATSSLNNREMYSAMKYSDGNIKTRLEWMFSEGTSWNHVKAVLALNTQDLASIRTSTTMRNNFADICTNKTMIEAVNVLGGDINFKLKWMFHEGTSWKQVKAILALNTDSLASIRSSTTMRSNFTGICTNKTMAEAVNILGGDINFKLDWMFHEGTNWEQVKAILAVNTDSLVSIRSSTTMRANFAGICTNKTMVEAVDALGGDLNFKLNWMAFEGASVKNVHDKIKSAPDAELPLVLADPDTLKQLEGDFSKSKYQKIVQMLNGLLVSEEIDTNATEKHFEDYDSDGTWEEESFGWDVNYDIEYHRTKLKIIVRIKLAGQTVPAPTQAAWLTGIQNRWNGHFHIDGPRRLAIEITPIFTNTNSHVTVNVKSGSGRENRTNWYLTTTGNTAAHEFGHMIGLEDEYQLSASEYTRLIGSSPTAVGSTAVPHVPSGGFSSSDQIMQSGIGNVKRRHLASFVTWLNNNRLPGEAVYRLRLGP